MLAGATAPDRTGVRQEHYVLRMLDTLQREPGRSVVHWRDGLITAGEFRSSILAFATALHAVGVDATTTVAILSEPNLPVLLSARYGAHLLGSAVTHIRSMNARTDSERLSVAEQIRILRDSAARVLIIDEVNAEGGRMLAGSIPGLTLVHIDDVHRTDDAVPEFAPYLAGNLAVIDLTSGSANTPKLVRQSFGVREARIQVSAGESEPGYRVTLLSVTPISHSTATMADAVLISGGAVVLHTTFDEDDVLRAIAELRITDVYLAVPHLYRLLDHPRIREADLTSLRQVLYSGTAAAPARIAEAVAVFGDALAQLYGSTEAGGICALTPLDHREPELLGTVGKPFSWVNVEVRRTELDAEVEPGEIGEVCVRSPTVMASYSDGREVIDRALRKGWLRTGDLGYWDRYGYLHLVGRISNVIKANGLKIYPAAIEDVLLSHPAVANAAVYGVRDHDYAERVHAAVQFREGVSCTAEDLRRHLAAALSSAHIPADITLWNEIPLNGTGKPDYKSLRAAATSSPARR